MDFFYLISILSVFPVVYWAFKELTHSKRVESTFSVSRTVTQGKPWKGPRLYARMVEKGDITPRVREEFSGMDEDVFRSLCRLAKPWEKGSTPELKSIEKLRISMTCHGFPAGSLLFAAGRNEDGTYDMMLCLRTILHGDYFILSDGRVVTADTVDSMYGNIALEFIGGRWMHP